MSVKPHRRYSYWVFLLIGACASIQEVLPSLKDLVPPWAYVLLVLAGIFAQYIKQEGGLDEPEDSTGGK